MLILLSLSMAIAPSFILVRYYQNQDKLKPEPIGLVIKIFFIGLLSTVPILFLEIGMGWLGHFFHESRPATAFFKAFFIAALCEETIKFLVVKKYIYNHKNFDEISDGIMYTIIASLGFACLENVLYVLNGTFTTALVRAFTAVPLHALASGIMGYYIGLAKFSQTSKHAKAWFLKGLFIAILIHGGYDFFLFSAPFLGAGIAFLIIPLLFGSYVFLQKKIKFAIRRDVDEGRI